MLLVDSSSFTSSSYLSASSSTSHCPSSYATSGTRAIPIELLALIFRYLSLNDLLRLLRCCSTLRRLTTQSASFNAVAWSAASLDLHLSRLNALGAATFCMRKRRPPYRFPHGSRHCQSCSTRLSQWEQGWCCHESDWKRKREALAAMSETFTAKQPTKIVRVHKQGVRRAQPADMECAGCDRSIERPLLPQPVRTPCCPTTAASACDDRPAVDTHTACACCPLARSTSAARCGWSRSCTAMSPRILSAKCSHCFPS